MILTYHIEEEVKIKHYLHQAGFPDQVLKEIKGGNGQYIVNDQTVMPHYLMHKGDTLQVVLPVSEAGENIVSTLGDIDIVYEDAYILILNKPANIATIPTREHFLCSLANFVMSYYKRVGIEANIHFVSRLDAATSGLIMLAKNSYLTYLLQNTNIQKRYLLETVGIVTPSEGIIEKGIEKDENSIIKRKIVDDYVNSKTIYHTVSTSYENISEGSSLIDALLCTGKTHQLRLHFSSLGYPIVGDELYGTPTDDGILHLHSYHLEFTHPVTKEELCFECYPSWYKNNN